MPAFDRHVRATLGPDLRAAGYEALSRSRFVRRSVAGLRHLIILDPRPTLAHPTSFRVMIVVNAVVLDGDEGGHLVRYFSGGSLSSSPRDLPASGAALDKSLDRVRVCYPTILDPWLQAFHTPHDLAVALDDPHLDFYRAQLLVLGGHLNEAKAECSRYLARLVAQGYSVEEQRSAEKNVAALLTTGFGA